MKKTYELNHYDHTATKIVRVSRHTSESALRRAIARAVRAGEIVGRPGNRTVDDPPTCHH